ncbi:MAG: type IV pili methyl-accepting chemotaxis transducer N-terminal domain-containing protein, partial [Myxococcota bacterium]
PARRARVVALVASIALLSVESAAEPLMDYEYGGALAQLGRLRMLGERLSKQNVLYQLHLADQHKLELIETAGEIQETLELLRSGRPLMAVPRPPNELIRKQLGEIEAAWLPLQRMAKASPFEHLRRSREFIDPKDERGDPLLILYFDDLARRLVEEASQAARLYVEACDKDGWTNCEEAAVAGIPHMLTERIVKEAVLVFAGMEPEENQERLKATRKELEGKLAQTGGIELVKQATDSESGESGSYAAELWQDIGTAWRRLDDELELVVRGHAEERNLRRVVSLQVVMVGDMQRLAVALEQFAAVGQATPGLPTDPTPAVSSAPPER